MDLVLYHHNHTKSNYPDLCSILKKADHHSASEREDIDDTQEVNKTPLISLFSKIVLEGNGKVDEQYIPLNKLSLDDGSFNNLKPAAKKDTMGGWNLVPEYNRLWDEFNSEFELIQNKTDFNTLLALLKKYASTMPSAAYKSKSDISLYDHSKTTAALAVSRYLFNRDGDVKLTQTNDLNCYLAIEGDISGIQKFIFKISSPQEAQSGMSKRLRGRSLYLTLLCDAIATHIAEELELCEANILFCGGGRFTIIGPNTKTAKEKLAEIKSKLNKFFIDEFNAELYLALVSIECCGDDLAKFGQITRKLSNKLNEDKKHKFSDNLDDVFNFDEEIKYDDLLSFNKTNLYPIILGFIFLLIAILFASRLVLVLCLFAAGFLFEFKSDNAFLNSILVAVIPGILFIIIMQNIYYLLMCFIPPIAGCFIAATYRRR